MSAQLSAVTRHACPTCLAVFRKSFARCPLDGAVLGPIHQEPLLGVTLADRYVVEACIGEGGMGQVYRAKHKRISRRFAIKVLYGDLVADAAMRERFSREAEAASRLSHPNLVSVVDFGETDKGLLYLVMEFVDGPSLAHLITQHGPLGTDRTMSLLRQMAAGLEHAHQKSLVHRDFKPDNVVITQSGDGELAKILDFGIARIVDDGSVKSLTTQGMVMGTPAFMAPEQASGGTVDQRSDLFSLGLVLYEMAAGVLPFEGDAMSLLRQNFTLEFPAMAERVPGLAVDPRVEALANRLAAKKPKERFQSATELIAEIDSWWTPSRSRREPAGVAAPTGAAQSASGRHSSKEDQALGLANTAALPSSGAAAMLMDAPAGPISTHADALRDTLASGPTPAPLALAATQGPMPTPANTPESDLALASTLRPDDPASPGPVPRPAPGLMAPPSPHGLAAPPPAYLSNPTPAPHAPHYSETAPGQLASPHPNTAMVANQGMPQMHPPVVAAPVHQARKRRWPLIVLALLLCGAGVAVAVVSGQNSSDTSAATAPSVTSETEPSEPTAPLDSDTPQKPSEGDPEAPTASPPDSPVDSPEKKLRDELSRTVTAKELRKRLKALKPQIRKLEREYPYAPAVAKLVAKLARIDDTTFGDPELRQEAHRAMVFIERRFKKIRKRKERKKKQRAKSDP